MTAVKNTKGVITTENTDILDIFSSSPLFYGAKRQTVDYAVSHCIVKECKKGSVFEARYPCLFILLSGAASVCGISKNHPVILNTLKKGRAFGMASLFGEKCETTSVKAKENCIYALLPQKIVEDMLQKDIGFTKNYITFLSEKIRFLNKKIAFFTSGSTEKKVAGYILSLPLDDNNCVTPDMNMSKLAQHLDIGRASLYRALDSLEESCFISKNGNVIKIISPEEFKKIYGESL